jgi:hypothetical protein
MLNIPGLRKMQIKTTLRFYLTPTNVGKDVRKKEFSYTIGGNVN